MINYRTLITRPMFLVAILSLLVATVSPVTIAQDEGTVSDRLATLEKGQAEALRALRTIESQLAELRRVLSAGRSGGSAPSSPELPLPTQPVSISGMRKLGNRDAPIALIEYSDFQCPYCARFFQTTWPVLRKEFIDTGKILFAFGQLPLAPIHPLATKAAEAAECAGRQSRFWEMHDSLFSNPSQLNLASLSARAAALGLNGEAFAGCLDGGAVAAVQASVEQARRLQINGTPHFLIGRNESGDQVRVTRRVGGAIPFAALKPMLDQALMAH